WTIVGAYIVRGQKNDTHTMLDTVVYDIPSRKMLFRAPGLSEIKGSATLVNQSEQLRTDSEAGVSQATADMIKNLDAQLLAFREKVKERPEEYRVVRTEGYRGSGMVDGLMLALLGALLGGAVLYVAEPELAVYGGLSGIVTAAATYLCLHGIEEDGAYRWLCLGVLLCLAVKTGCEIALGFSPLPGADAEGFALVPQSHAVGAATAIALFALEAR